MPPHWAPGTRPAPFSFSPSRPSRSASLQVSAGAGVLVPGTQQAPGRAGSVTGVPASSSGHTGRRSLLAWGSRGVTRKGGPRCLRSASQGPAQAVSVHPAGPPPIVQPLPCKAGARPACGSGGPMWALCRLRRLPGGVTQNLEASKPRCGDRARTQGGADLPLTWGEACWGLRSETPHRLPGPAADHGGSSQSRWRPPTLGAGPGDAVRG